MDPGRVLPAYVLVEPLVAGRVVLDLFPARPEGPRRLERAGARQILTWSRPEGPLDVDPEEIDVVLCLSWLDADTPAADWERWLAEARRVVKPDGMCIVRVPADGPSGVELPVLERRLSAHFPGARIVEEGWFAGASFVVSGTDDVAVQEALHPLPGPPTHHVAFCGVDAEMTSRWWSAESLLVPVAALSAMAGDEAVRLVGAEERAEALRAELDELQARHRELCDERDGLREATLGALDRGDRRDEAMAALRRESERHLRQMADDAGAIELLTLDRDRALAQVAALEQALATATAQLRRRDVDLQGLERELGRLAARAAKAPT
jgi:hypothetical protein